MLDWTEVVSSNIKAIGYDADSEELHFKFMNGTEYAYYGAPKEVYDEMMQAPSKGKFFYSEIKDKFVYRKIG